MKSLVEEASSITKAIEKGWTNAGHPKEFTIKIYEEPQKNFIGMTVRPAKIGIFFTESAFPKVAEAPQGKRGRAGQEQGPKTPSAQADTRPLRARAPLAKEPVQKKEQKVVTREQTLSETGAPEQPQRQGPIWTDEMIATVKDWITEMLPLMDFDHIPFTVNAQHFHLKIQFQNSLYDDKNRQKYLFASLSNVLLTMLKRHYKRPLKGYKIVLLGE